MKPQVTLVLICFLLCEAFQASAALKCCSGVNSLCLSTDCKTNEDRCATGASGTFSGISFNGKGCATKAMCESPEAIGKTSCCSTDLCNSAEGITLSLLMMLVPLLSSVLFF